MYIYVGETQILPILRGGHPDFAGENRKAPTPLVMFSEWPLNVLFCGLFRACMMHMTSHHMILPMHTQLGGNPLIIEQMSSIELCSKVGVTYHRGIISTNTCVIVHQSGMEVKSVSSLPSLAKTKSL